MPSTVKICSETPSRLVVRAGQRLQRFSGLPMGFAKPSAQAPHLKKAPKALQTPRGMGPSMAGAPLWSAWHCPRRRQARPSPCVQR